ncbi:hypothetical protein ABMY26_01825 [Azospirillum sp. HJ39]|uniref:hypothetical protein n=1 Tax=Azospirillum sp. HJ39 TaxID=3159496 RepID=UPI003558EE67
MHSVEPQGTPSSPVHISGSQSADVQLIADRYGWSTPMARWWMAFAASSVGPKQDTMIAFLDKTVGGVTMIRRR